jgi:hypothetical protein
VRQSPADAGSDEREHHDADGLVRVEREGAQRRPARKLVHHEAEPELDEHQRGHRPVEGARDGAVAPGRHEHRDGHAGSREQWAVIFERCPTPRLDGRQPPCR